MTGESALTRLKIKIMLAYIANMALAVYWLREHRDIIAALMVLQAVRMAVNGLVAPRLKRRFNVDTTTNIVFSCNALINIAMAVVGQWILPLWLNIVLLVIVADGFSNRHGRVRCLALLASVLALSYAGGVPVLIALAFCVATGFIFAIAEERTDLLCRALAAAAGSSGAGGPGPQSPESELRTN